MTAVLINALIYVDDDTEHERLLVEHNGDEVDLIVAPFTEAARTYTLSADETWRLVRQLAEAATHAGSEDD